MTYRECYEYGRKVLRKASVPDADLDARLLLEFVCQTSYNDLLLYGDRVVEEERASSYKMLIQKRKERVPLQYLINLKYTDEELEPLYQIWFAQNSILVNHKNAWGKTPLEIAEQMSYRASLLERMKKYE